MGLRLYNTLTRQKEDFAPLDPARVRMYVCGPTVYDRAHIGNARPVIVFDVLFRLLRHLYGAEHVTYVRNITDVDDKINARAAEQNISIRELTDKTYSWFKEDVAALGCLAPTHEPRATEHIDQMKELIERLIESNNAYVKEDHVLFHVPSMPDYGKLSHRSLEDMIAGARVEVAPYKRDPMDFVLWKPSDQRKTNIELPAWRSPGKIDVKGRPGWHIECSAMSWEYLGEIFDIHGGGIDLVFPHHENELAQSRCAFHTNLMAQVWMHNGFVQMQGEKMAKSEGNVVTIRELLTKLPGDVLRLQMLKTNYRQPMDWTERSTWQAQSELSDWAHALNQYYEMSKGTIADELVDVLSDDLNTPEAITVLRGLYSKAKKGALGDILDFAASCKFLGFRNLNQPGLFDIGVTSINVDREGPSVYDTEMTELRAAIANNAPEATRAQLIATMTNENQVVEIERDGRITLVGGREAFERKVRQLIERRIEARKNKNWTESDHIRDELKKMGVVVEDKKDGTTTWELAR